MSKTKRRTERGFTLIELMIVVAIIGILAAIAYPAYRDSVLKGKRAQARTALLELMQQQERYMTQRNTYLDFSTSVAGVVSAVTTTPLPSPLPLKNYSGDNATSPSYWISAAACANQALNECIQLTAAPTGADAVVGSLTLTSTGVKGCSGSAKDSNFRLCWP